MFVFTAVISCIQNSACMLNVTMKCVWLPCRLLENEIQQLQKENAAKEKQFYQQIEQLKKENNRQQKLIVKVCSIVVWCLLSTYGHLTFEAKIPASLQMSTNTPVFRWLCACGMHYQQLWCSLSQPSPSKQASVLITGIESRDRRPPVHDTWSIEGCTVLEDEDEDGHSVNKCHLLISPDF